MLIGVRNYMADVMSDQPGPPAWPDFAAAHLLVVGDVMLDRYWSGPAKRISPEAPVPVVHVSEHEDRLGGAGNVAANIAHLGCQVGLAGVVGNDQPGEAVQRLLAERAIHSALHVQTVSPTITKLRVLAQHQQLLRLDFEESLAGLDSGELHRRCQAQLTQMTALVLSDYAKGTLQAAPALIQMARERGVPVIVDPKGDDFRRYRGASVLTPNLAELERIVGPCSSDRILREKAEALRAELDLTALLVTLGERGMLLLSANAAPLHLPARAQDVFDVTGAGDTVVAVLAAALAAGQSMVTAADLANVAAGIVVGRVGTSSVSETELRAAWRERHGDASGQVDAATLLALREAARRRGERVVMTNGCFDLLHAGHVAYLEQARALGERLIVAVNDDASVVALKGAGRPINTLAQRMAVLAGLRAVDWVVSFSEPTPGRLICAVQPDILVKGGDYRPPEIAGHDCVTAAGGEVKVLGFLPGCSTSAMLAAIRGRAD